MHIRKATPADADMVYGFINALEEKKMSREGFDECYAYNLRSSHSHYLLAEAEDRVIGFLSCHGQMLLHHAGWVYEIQELYIDHEWRSKGVGKQLLETIEAILADVEYDVLEVSSNASRIRAHSFYLQNGFEQTSLKFVKKSKQADTTQTYTTLHSSS